MQGKKTEKRKTLYMVYDDEGFVRALVFALDTSEACGIVKASIDDKSLVPENCYYEALTFNKDGFSTLNKSVVVLD